jgi:hypothetical protein
MLNKKKMSIQFFIIHAKKNLTFVDDQHREIFLFFLKN